MTHQKNSNLLRLVACSTGLLVLLSACTSEKDISDGASEELHILLADQDVVDSAPVWLADQQGFFKDEGLDVEIVPGSDGSSASQIPLIISGSADVVVTTTTAAIQASSQNMPVGLVSGLTVFGDDKDNEPSGILMPGEAHFTSAKDLEGKTFAINGLRSLSEALVKEMISHDGGDPEQVEFLQVPTGNIGDLVRTGGADAGYLPDPFFSREIDKGLEVLSRPAAVVAAGVPTTSVISTTAFIEQHPDAVEKIQHAIERGAEYATSHPDEVLAITAEKLKISVDELQASTPPMFNAELDQSKIEKLITILDKHGALDAKVDISDLLR